MKIRLALVGAFLAVCAMFVLGAGRNQPVSQVSASKGVKTVSTVETYQAGITGAWTPSTITSATIGIATSVSCGGFEKVALNGTFDTASATIVVTALRFAYDGTNLELIGSEQATLTAGATFQLGGGYVSTGEIEFETKGASIMKFVWAAPSAGTVDLRTAKAH